MKLLAIYLFWCAVSAILGWLAGYNFDTRGADVAVWVGATAFLAFVFTPLTLETLATCRKD